MDKRTVIGAGVLGLALGGGGGACVGINIERASNGYNIRANGSSVVEMTLEDVQQHVTAIIVSNLVME